MLGNLGLHIIEFPSKRWGFVGTVPTTLCTEVPATTSDVLGCRTHRGPEGAICAWHVPSFATEQEAREFAASHSATVSN